MSIETRRNSDAYEDPQDNITAESTELQNTKALPNITPAELRAKMHPDRKPSILERIKEGRAGRYLTFLAIGGTLATGGIVASEVAKGLGEQSDNDEPVITGPIVAGQSETAAPQQSVEPTPSVSPSNITPLETAAPTIDTKEQLIASLELSAEKYPDVTSLGKAIMVDRYTAWINSGATQEARDEFTNPSINPDKSADDFAQEKVLEDADVFPKALFVENYNEIPSLARNIDDTTKQSGSVLGRRLITWNDDAPYERTMGLSAEPKLVSGSIESGEVTFTVSWIDSSNAADNKIGTKYDANDIHPHVGTRTITTVIVDGKWKIADLKFQ